MDSTVDDFSVERARMVEAQLIPRGIKDARVLAAMRKVPRQHFIPGVSGRAAYTDRALGIDQNQTISQPYIVALMTQLLALKGTERVLEIGTGSGYQTAILCELAAWVYSVERIPELAIAAQAHLENVDYGNFSVHIADGSLGWQQHAPYDAILVAAASPQVPTALLSQLAEGGRLVIPVGERSLQLLQLWQRVGDETVHRDDIPVVFVPLIGEQGWQS